MLPDIEKISNGVEKILPGTEKMLPDIEKISNGVEKILPGPRKMSNGIGQGSHVFLEKGESIGISRYFWGKK